MSEHDRTTRRAALRVLYAMDVSEMDADHALDDIRDTLEDDEQQAPDWDGVVERVVGVDEQLDEIDDEIRQLSSNWRIERMGVVDRNLLRLGIYEILEEVTAPLFVINACVELAKEFGTETTPGFINGLLDQLCQNHDIPIEPSKQRSG